MLCNNPASRLMNVDILQDLMQKTIALVHVTGEKKFSSSLSKLVKNYAELLASQGLLTTAMYYRKLLSSEVSSHDLAMFTDYTGVSAAGFSPPRSHMGDQNTNVNPDNIHNKKLEEIARKRKEPQNMEIELRAQAMARSEMNNRENRFQLKISEHIEAASLLNEQLGERQQHIEQLEMKLVEIDWELGAVKLENEAAWAENDLLREQFKELATLRRELDNSEAERAQCLQQMHDLREQIQEKECQILLLEEQNRAAQETFLQALQAQLQDCTEQFNQYWIGLQRQFVEVERRHLQTIQQLQLELVEAKERNGVNKDGTTDLINHQPAQTQQNLSGSDHHHSSDNHVNWQQLGQSFQPSLVFKRSVIAVHEQMTVSVSRLSQDQLLASAKGKGS